MTTSIAREVAKKKKALAGGVPLTFRGALVSMFKAALATATALTFPLVQYQADPIGFARNILGFFPWAKQAEILIAIRDFIRVTVKSGHKIGKSSLFGVAALWYYSCFPDAQVVMTSTTSRQVDQILWREVRMRLARSGRCLECIARDPEQRTILRPCPHSALIPEEPGQLARTGLRSKDFRTIVGFTAREAEAVAGVSGANLLYLADEASGIPEPIFEAIDGNMAGGARICMAGNPTKTKGRFYDSFQSDLYEKFTVSSRETPNAISGERIVPGLAESLWIEQMEQEYGADSAWVKVRIDGEFAVGEDGKIFTIETIAEAELRWEEIEGEGRLFLGVDPAGATGTGDETAFARRRGQKCEEITVRRGLTASGILASVLGELATHRRPREVPVVVLDGEGSVGAECVGTFRAHLESHPGDFVLVIVRASDKAIRQPQVYDRMRDELTGNLERWIKNGGAIPQDTKLEAELHEPEWEEAINGRLKVTKKRDLKRELGRSPDRYDALALCCWEPLHLQEGLPPSAQVDVYKNRPGAGLMDPYAGMNAWDPRKRNR